MTTPASGYLLAGQASEIERLQLQSRTWEPAGRAFLEQIPVPHSAARALDVGCGAMGWLRILSQWLGNSGTVIGSDLDEGMLRIAGDFVRVEGLANVELRKDDLFRSMLGPGSFDLVHARFQIAPLGRAEAQLGAFLDLLKPGGVLMLEEPDMSSWRVNPPSPNVTRLIELIGLGFKAAGGNFDAGRELPALMQGTGIQPRLRAEVIALESRHPYLRLPLQFARALRTRLEAILPASELDALIAGAESELSRPDVWGTTFTLIQASGRKSQG